MKSKIFKLVMTLVLFALFLTACSSSRYSKSERADRRASHNRGVNNRHYVGY